MEDPQPEETVEEQVSAKERSPRSPRSPGGRGLCRITVCLNGIQVAQRLVHSHLGALQCTHCLITFADSKFQERHMKREHPADFVAQKLQGTLFICFTCLRSFPSSKALIAHQRGHKPGTRPTYPCPDCGKVFRQAASLSRHRQVHETQAPAGPFACTECGQDFAQEAGLHQHYIRHARGEL